MSDRTEYTADPTQRPDWLAAQEEYLQVQANYASLIGPLKWRRRYEPVESAPLTMDQSRELAEAKLRLHTAAEVFNRIRERSGCSPVYP